MEKLKHNVLKRKRPFDDTGRTLSGIKQKCEEKKTLNCKRKVTDDISTNTTHAKRTCRYTEWTEIMRQFQESKYCCAFGYGQYTPITTLPNVLEI